MAWVFDELQDEVDSKIDPDFVLPEEMCGKDGVFRKKSAKIQSQRPSRGDTTFDRASGRADSTQVRHTQRFSQKLKR